MNDKLDNGCSFNMILSSIIKIDSLDTSVPAAAEVEVWCNNDGKSLRTSAAGAAEDKFLCNINV